MQCSLVPLSRGQGRRQQSSQMPVTVGQHFPDATPAATHGALAAHSADGGGGGRGAPPMAKGEGPSPVPSKATAGLKRGAT